METAAEISCFCVGKQTKDSDCIKIIQREDLLTTQTQNEKIYMLNSKVLLDEGGSSAEIVRIL